MGRTGLFAIVVALLVAAANHTAVAESATFRVGTSRDYAPFSYVSDGRLEGLDLSVARAYAEERGLALEVVPFRWPKLLDDLAAGRFEVAMSGVTVGPERSMAGRFSVPVADSGAVVLVRDDGRFSRIEDLDQRGVRIAVNAGGHLEGVSRTRFRRATLLFIPDNAAVIEALLTFAVDAAVSDTLEAAHWLELDEDFVQLGPFTRDRKAYLVRADRPGLAADLDAWLLEHERDGSLQALRQRFLPEAARRPTATPLAALVAALDERLALMPGVVAAKRREVLPIEDRRRETRVLSAAVAAVADAAGRRRRTPPAEEAVRAFFQAQIDAAKQVQLTVGRELDVAQEAAAPDLDGALRPALLRIGARIAELVLALPADLDPSQTATAVREGLRSPYLSDATRRSLAAAIVRISRAGPEAPPTSGSTSKH